MISDEHLATLVKQPSRVDLWTALVKQNDLSVIAEIGVYRGSFTESLLNNCPGISKYYMVDPWRNLPDWNKPANKDNETFESFYAEATSRTNRWDSKRIILRGRTTEVVGSIPDDSLDFAYIDADHTLRGICVDLIRLWPKVRHGGFVGGDDFCRSIWQHSEDFEPTLVFPFAVYFAEAVGTPILALPHNQFLIQKVDDGFNFSDTTGIYDDLTLRGALGSRDGMLQKRWTYRAGSSLKRGALDLLHMLRDKILERSAR